MSNDERSAGGRDADALRLLESQEFRARTFASFSGFTRRSFGRFLRAELLAKLGRDREALAWFQTFDGDAFWGAEYVYGTPAVMRLGEIHERLGNRDRAVAYYRRFVARWSAADSEYQPLVRDVQARIIRLKSR